MNTISFELSKRLNELGLLDDVETEFYINVEGELFTDLQNQLADAFDNIHKFKKLYKTLTLEEAIEFLPKTLDTNSVYNRGLIISQYYDGRTTINKIEERKREYPNNVVSLDIQYNDGWRIDYKIVLGSWTNSIATIISDTNNIGNHYNAKKFMEKSEFIFNKLKNRKPVLSVDTNLLLAIEKMITYLLDNNLLFKK